MDEGTLDTYGIKCFQCLYNEGKHIGVNDIYGASMVIDVFNPNIHIQNPTIIKMGNQFYSKTYDNNGHCVWLCMSKMVSLINPEMAQKMIDDLNENPSDHLWLGYKTKKDNVTSGISLFQQNFKSYKPMNIEISRIKGAPTILEYENLLKSWEHGDLKEQNPGGLFVGFLAYSHCVGIDLEEEVIYDPSSQWGKILKPENLIDSVAKADNNEFKRFHGLYILVSNHCIRYKPPIFCSQ